MTLKSLPKPKLFMVLLVVPAILWSGVIALGLQGLSSIQDTQTMARHDRDQLNIGVQTSSTILAIQFHFKTQVQEWKNILLRGHDAQKRQRHLQQFQTEEMRVQQKLDQLRLYLQKLGIFEKYQLPISEIIEDLRTLGVYYKKAYEQFINLTEAPDSVVDTGRAAHEADKVVAGQDRRISEKIDQLSKTLVNHVQLMIDIAKERDEDRFTEITSQVQSVLAGLGLFLLPLLLWIVRTHIILPITRMTTAMEQVADGDLKQRVPQQSMNEPNRMCLSFNQMAEKLEAIYSGLQTERDKLTTIIVAAQEGIIVTDRNDQVVLINPAAERLLQKSSEQIIQEGFLNLLDDPEYIRAHLDHSGIDIPTTVLYRNRVLNLHANSIHTSDGIKIGSAALFRDVTEEKQLEKQLRTLSNTDGLTGLYNRRRLDELLHDEFIRAKRYKQYLSFLMLDVDHFKRFNDEHGHDLGDRVLQVVAKVMQSICRDVDFPCRYGGEEFCFILPNTAKDGAQRMAERLRSGVEQMRMNGLQVTISVGIAVYPLVGLSPETLQKAADHALYQAKRNGRNQCCLAEAEIIVS
ncbi:MAG: diguanylate cyclase, partial [Magnetococcales bacterium]|nr:diguanylate cyclase [Magnetococcales bacterium]